VRDGLIFHAQVGLRDGEVLAGRAGEVALAGDGNGGGTGVDVVGVRNVVILASLERAAVKRDSHFGGMGLGVVGHVGNVRDHSAGNRSLRDGEVLRGGELIAAIVVAGDSDACGVHASVDVVRIGNRVVSSGQSGLAVFHFDGRFLFDAVIDRGFAQNCDRHSVVRQLFLVDNKFAIDGIDRVILDLIGVQSDGELILSGRVALFIFRANGVIGIRDFIAGQKTAKGDGVTVGRSLIAVSDGVVRNVGGQALGGNIDRECLCSEGGVGFICAGDRSSTNALCRKAFVIVKGNDRSIAYHCGECSIFALFFDRIIVAVRRSCSHCIAIDHRFGDSEDFQTGVFFFDDVDGQLQDEELFLFVCNTLYAGVGRFVVVDLQAERDGRGLASIILRQAALEVQRQCTSCLVKGRRRHGKNFDITSDNSVGSHPVLVVRIIEDVLRQAERAERNIHTGRCVADVHRMRVFTSIVNDDGNYLPVAVFDYRARFIELVIVVL